MKYVLLLLCTLGIVVSSLALREHYRTEGFAPCDINEKWDCGIVNQPLRNGRQSSSGSYWNRGISAHGCAGFSTCISIVAGTGTHRIGIRSLPGTYREGHSRSVVRVLRDLIGHDFVANITGVRHSAVTVAAAPVSGAGSWLTMNELGKLLLVVG